MPDRPVGRKQELQSSPVKIFAEKYGLKIEQPITLKNYELEIRNYGLNVVVDYGMLIPQNIIDAPKFGTINVHPSLLPKYRGPSPIQSALMNGEKETGVSIMLIDAKMDHGPILTKKTIQIDKDDTYPVLAKKLAGMASTMLIEAIESYVAGKIISQPQNDKLATFCQFLTREDGRVNFNKTAPEIYNQYRGLAPWPGVYVEIKNEKLKMKNYRLKLLKIITSDKMIDVGKMAFDKDKIFIGCNDGAIEVLELQLEGKKAMSAKDFINGNKQLNNMSLRGA